MLEGQISENKFIALIYIYIYLTWHLENALLLKQSHGVLRVRRELGDPLTALYLLLKLVDITGSPNQTEFRVRISS